MPRIKREKPTILDANDSSFSVKALPHNFILSRTTTNEIAIPIITANNIGRIGILTEPNEITCLPINTCETKITAITMSVVFITGIRSNFFVIINPSL